MMAHFVVGGSCANNGRVSQAPIGIGCSVPKSVPKHAPETGHPPANANHEGNKIEPEIDDFRPVL